jgi:hypothetical protein
MSEIENLIQHALDQDYNKANQIFGDLMGEKIDDALEQEKINIANQAYNGIDSEEEIDDEDIEEVDDEDFDEEDEDFEEDEEDE